MEQEGYYHPTYYIYINLKTGVIIRMTLGDKKETKKIRENKESI